MLIRLALRATVVIAVSLGSALACRAQSPAAWTDTISPFRAVVSP